MLEQQFLDAISSAGIPPSHKLLLDGNLRRYNIQGDKKGRRNGWYRYVHVRDDFAWAVFGCNKRGISEKWSSREKHEITAYDKKLIKARQAEIKHEEEETQAAVALKANTLWNRLRGANSGHPYLLRKGVTAYGLREMYKSLVVPVYVDNYIVTLQFISEEGDKRFMKGGVQAGGYFCIWPEAGAPDVIYICEGYATGASVFAALGKPVVVAFNAYNLIPVAESMRARYPQARIVIAADHDQWTDSPMRNPGLSRAQEAADKVGGTVVYPHFDYEDKARPTDWNDYHVRFGLEALTQALLQIKPPEVKQELVDERAWRRDLIPGKETRTGYPDFDPKSKDNAYLFLQNHEFFKDMVAYNMFSARLVLTRRPPWEGGKFVPRPLANRDYFHAMRLLERLGVRTSKDVVEDAFEALGEDRRVNPPHDYLEALRWDRVPRLNTWLTYYLGAERQNPEYLALVGAKWLMGAVSRVYAPGTKFDNVLILEGGQGTKKSMLFKKLTSFHESPYFLEFSGDVTHKDSLGMMQGRLVVEMSELASMRRTISEDMKTFVTREIDTFRPAWGRTILERDRRFILAATTNNDSGDGYLVDPTGGRRYWPVACGNFDMDALVRDKDQLWAEAVARWKQGERTWLEGDEESELAKFEQGERHHEDSWLEPIEFYLLEKQETDVYKVCKEAIGLSGEQIKKANEDRARHCLKKLGWERAGRPRMETDDGKRRITVWKRAIGREFS